MTANAPTILILDDEFMVAWALAEDLQEHGFTVAGPFTSAKDAEAHLETQRPDGAFLDINLGNGQTSLELAAKLRSMEVPFAFLTGYSSLGVDDPDLDQVPRLGKPVSTAMAVAEAKRFCS